MLTNFNTIAGRVKKMQEYERMRSAGDFDAMPKKEALILTRELDKLQRNLGGIRDMTKLPDAVFVIDTKKEHIAVTEANKLGLPIVAVVDTNCDPDLITYVIPGNDDAIRAGTLMCRVIADAVEEGRFIASRRAARSGAPRGRRGPAAARSRGGGPPGRAAARRPPPGRHRPGRAGSPAARPPGGEAEPPASATPDRGDPDRAATVTRASPDRGRTGRSGTRQPIAAAPAAAGPPTRRASAASESTNHQRSRDRAWQSSPPRMSRPSGMPPEPG